MKTKAFMSSLLSLSLIICLKPIPVSATENIGLYGGLMAIVMDSECGIEKVESEIVTSTEEEPPECPYTLEDMELLAKVIYAEAGAIKNDETLHYVGSVVMNRVASDLYEDNIHDVVYSTEWGIQYACAYNGSLNKSDCPDMRCREIATEVLDMYYETGETYLPSNVLGQAGFVTLHGCYLYQDGIYFSYY